MLKKARFVSMIILAASILATAGLMVENLILAMLDPRKRR